MMSVVAPTLGCAGRSQSTGPRMKSQFYLASIVGFGAAALKLLGVFRFGLPPNFPAAEEHVVQVAFRRAGRSSIVLGQLTSAAWGHGSPSVGPKNAVAFLSGIYRHLPSGCPKAPGRFLIAPSRQTHLDRWFEPVRILYYAF